MSAASVSDALVRALFHFLWEGAAISLVLAAAIHLLRPASARVRYALACFAMLGMLAAFGITIARLWPSPIPAPSVRFTLHNPAADVIPSPGGPSLPVPAPSRIPWIATLWLGGVCLLSLRSLASWIGAMRIRRVGVCTVSDAWQRKLVEFAHRIKLSRAVTLLESSLTDTPAVVGFLRPVILMPAGLLAGFPPDQLEFILLHELAHIRRYDYFVNLLQCVAEDLLFYHPAVWWVSSLIRAEREHCCDDVVVAATGNAPGFASVLAALEHDRWAAREAVLAATGGHLMNRIRRLLDGREHLRPAAAPAFAAGLLLAGAALAVAAAQSRPAPVLTTPMTPMVNPSPSPGETGPVSAPMPQAQLVMEPLLLAQAKPDAPPAPAAQTELDRKAEWQKLIQGLKAKKPIDGAGLYIITPEEVATFTRLLAQARPDAVTPAQQRQAAEEILRAQLETPYKKWLNQEVIYIISEQERDAFNRLQTDEERQMFIQQFWLRRDPTPDTKANEYQEEHYRRIGYADVNFGTNDVPGWKTDRGMIYIKFGPPDEREQHASGGTYQRPPEEGGGTTTVYPFERWRYRYIQGVGNNVDIEFVDSQRNGEYHMTTDPNRKDAQLWSPAGVAIRDTAPKFAVSCVMETAGLQCSVPVDAARAARDQFERLQRFANLQAPTSK